MHQNLLTEEGYLQAMMAKLIALDDKSINALECIGSTKILHKRGVGMENYFAFRIERTKIWQMVSKLGKTFYDTPCTTGWSVSAKEYR